MDDFGRCVIRSGDEGWSAERAARLRGLKREIDPAMRDLIADGIADGSIAAMDSQLLAFTLAGVCWFRPGGALHAAEVAGKMVDMLIAGLSPR